MIRNLIGIMMGVVAIVIAFLSNYPIIKIIAVVITTIIGVFAIMWTIGIIKDKKEEKNKKEQNP